MTDPGVLSDWYMAIWQNHCIQVMELLKANESLVKVGWERDLKRSEDGTDVSRQDSGSPWEGRTALHVGASQGCILLIEQVLKIYNVAIMDTDSNEDEQGAAAISSTRSTDRTGPRQGESNLSDSEITEGKGPITDDSPHDDTVLEVDEQKGPESAGLKTGSTNTGRVARLKRVVSTIIRSNRNSPAGDKSLEKAQPSAATLEMEPTKGNVSRLQESARSSDSSRHPPHETLAAQDLENNLDTTRNDPVDCKGLHDLLAVCAGSSGLNALKMAMQLGNEEMIDLLLCAEDQCEPRYPSFAEASRRKDFFLNKSKDLKEVEKERRDRGRLRAATKEFMDEFDDRLLSSAGFGSRYPMRYDFRPEEYVFHFLCENADEINGYERILDGLWRKIRSSEGELWRFLLQLQDGRGRPPFHVALDNRSTSSFKRLFVKSDDPAGDEDREVVICVLTTPDGAGRTPLHSAASKHDVGGVEFILKYFDKYKEVYATCNIRWKHKMWTTYKDACRELRPIRQIHDSPFGRQLEQTPQTPLQAAIILKNFLVAKLLIDKLHAQDLQQMVYKHSFVLMEGKLIVLEWDVIELAFLVGITTDFAEFLQRKGLLKPKECSTVGARIMKHPFNPVHLIASSGDYRMLRLLIHNSDCDAFIEDFQGNNALHHALMEKPVSFGTHFFDYGSEELFEYAIKLDMEEGDTKKEKAHETRIAERQGCTTLLIQAGCDIFKANKKNEVPYPEGFLSTDGKFLSFWFNTQAEEFKATQNNMNFAGNAIAVTAALVATASYVGPLQPPLGYGGDPNQIQDENIWVLMFIVFDTMSFYLAIAAITVSLIPSLPIPQQAMRDELQRTRGMVALAVGILFPSIIFVFGAFACSSMAVVSANTLSSTGGRLTLSTTCIGGFICGVGFLLFSIRLLAFIFPRNSWVKYVYGITGKIRAR